MTSAVTNPQLDPNSPHVLFIVLDSLRMDRVSYDESSPGLMPAIARFAADARCYTDAVTQAPWTLPSHASMFTGMYPWDHGATQQHPQLSPQQRGRPTLATRFREMGYHTLCVTSNPWITPFTGMTDGFDEVENFTWTNPVAAPLVQRLLRWLSRPGSRPVRRLLADVGDSLFAHRHRHGGDPHHTMASVDRVLSTLRTADGPVFGFVNLMDAHEPYYPRESYRERFAPDVDPRRVCQIPTDHMRGDMEADFTKISRLYDACVAGMDAQVDRLLTAVDRLGEPRETLIVITADHGQQLGEQGVFGHQFTVAPEVVEVPLLIRGPGIDPGTDTDPFELRSLYTMLPALAQGRRPAPIDRSVALGGYSFPQLVINQLPEELFDRYYRRLRYAIDRSRRLTVTETPAQTTTEMGLRATGEALPIDQSLLRRLSQEEAVTAAEVKFEASQRRRLMDLGYL